MLEILSGELYQVEARKKQLRCEFLNNHDPSALIEIDFSSNSELDLSFTDLTHYLTNTSLFANQKLVIIQYLSQASFVNQFKSIIELAEADRDLRLLLLEPQLDRRTAFGKYLAQHPQYRGYRPLENQALVGWLHQRAQALQTKLLPEVAASLIQRVGEDMTALDMQLQKLRVYPQIDQALITQLVVDSQQSQVFDLFEAIFKAQLATVLDLYQNQRDHKKNPLSILGALIWQLQVLLLVKTSKKSAEVLSREFKIHEFPLKEAKKIAPQLSLTYLRRFIDLCRQTDRRIRVDFTNIDEALYYLLIKACQLSQSN